MNPGDKIYAVYHYEILQGVIDKELHQSYQVDTEIGRRNVRFANCCTNEYSACDRLIIEAQELVKATEIRKARCASTAVMEGV